MKYYLLTVQYNKDAQAENRPVPKMFTDFQKAQAEFYTQVGKDMNNETLGGSLNMIVDENGGTYSFLNKQWGYMDSEEVDNYISEPVPDNDGADGSNIE